MTTTINPKLIIDPAKTFQAITKLSSNFRDQLISLEFCFEIGKYGSVEQGWVAYCADLGHSPRCLCPVMAVQFLVDKL